MFSCSINSCKFHVCPAKLVFLPDLFNAPTAIQEFDTQDKTREKTYGYKHNQHSNWQCSGANVLYRSMLTIGFSGHYIATPVS